MDILFSKPVQYIGRNGLAKQFGLALSVIGQDKHITIQPFNKRGLCKNTLMEIPLEDVPSLIAALQAMDISDSVMKETQSKLEGIMNLDSAHWKK
jgi:hypothetical protein